MRGMEEELNGLNEYIFRLGIGVWEVGVRSYELISYYC